MEKVSKLTNLYLARINHLLHKYAYEFWDMPNLLQKWVDKNYIYHRYTVEEFLVDIDQFSTSKNEDIVFITELKKMREEIEAKCTHVIVLPDVFSGEVYDIPGINIFPIKDVDGRNIVLFNNKPYRLMKERLQPIELVYDDKMYLFFNEANERNNELVIDELAIFCVYGIIPIADDSYNTSDIPSYDLIINEDFKAIDTEPNIHILIDLPWLTFTPDNVIEVTREKNDFDFGQDLNTLYKQHTHFTSEYKKIYHNRNVILSNTAIAYKEDMSFDIIDFENNKYDFIERVDKHTLRIKDFKDYIKIDLFLKPFNYIGYNRIDTLYDELMTKSHTYLDDIAYYEKQTNYIMAKYSQNRFLTWEQIEEVVNEFDFDLFNVIAQEFRTVFNMKITNTEKIGYLEEYKGIKSFGYKFIIEVDNYGEMDPVVFVNGKLIGKNLFTIRDKEKMYIWLNAEYVMDDLEFPTLNSLYLIKKNKEKMNKRGDNITVILLPRYKTNRYDGDIEYRHCMRLHTNPINKNIIMTAAERSPEEDHIMFINGLNMDCKLGPRITEYQPFELIQSPYSKENYRFFISNSGVGLNPLDLDFKHTKIKVEVPSDKDLVDTGDFIVDYYRSFIFDLDGRLMIPHIDYEILSCNKIFLTRNRFNIKTPEELLIVRPDYSDNYAGLFRNFNIKEKAKETSYNYRVMKLEKIQEVYNRIHDEEPRNEVITKFLPQSQIDFIRKFSEVYISALNKPFDEKRYDGKLAEYGISYVKNPPFSLPLEINPEHVKVGIESLNSKVYSLRVMSRTLQVKGLQEVRNVKINPNEDIEYELAIYDNDKRIEEHYINGRPIWRSGLNLSNNNW